MASSCAPTRGVDRSISCRMSPVTPEGHQHFPLVDQLGNGGQFESFRHDCLRQSLAVICSRTDRGVATVVIGVIDIAE